MEQRENQEAEVPTFQVIDKRQFLNLENIDKTEAAEEKPRYPSYVEELIGRMKEMEAAFQEKKKLMDDEIARVRVRLETDYERRLEAEKQKVTLQFLEVLDNLQRAVDVSARIGTVNNLLEGVQMTTHIFRSKLNSLGVEAIASLGQPFDPNLAQAVGIVPVEKADLDGTVVEELQTGYMMRGHLLRPAQVRVGRLKA